MRLTTRIASGMATPMTAIPAEKLDKVLQRWEFLQYELSQKRQSI